jgi:hypothetical protein
MLMMSLWRHEGLGLALPADDPRREWARYLGELELEPRESQAFREELIDEVLETVSRN